MVRVLIVDDQSAFRHQLGLLLAAAGMVVVGEAGDIPAAESLVTALQPDLAVVDVRLRGMSGIEGTPLLKALAPRMRVILISAYRDQADLLQTAAREVGAEAFISKDELDLEVVRGWSREQETENREQETENRKPGKTRKTGRIWSKDKGEE